MAPFRFASAKVARLFESAKHFATFFTKFVIFLHFCVKTGLLEAVFDKTEPKNKIFSNS